VLRCFSVLVPEKALILDWVFADGPPQEARNYDNNNFKDFHAIVPNSISEEQLWVGEELRIFKRLQQERKSEEEATQRKVFLFLSFFSRARTRICQSFQRSLQKDII
jgi:starch synthase